MATNLNLDDGLLTEACVRGGHRTKRQAATTALREYVDRLVRAEDARICSEAFADLGGSFDFDPDYDFKAARTPIPGRTG